MPGWISGLRFSFGILVSAQVMSPWVLRSSSIKSPLGKCRPQWGDSLGLFSSCLLYPLLSFSNEWRVAWWEEIASRIHFKGDVLKICCCVGYGLEVKDDASILFEVWTSVCMQIVAPCTEIQEHCDRNKCR